MVKPFNNFMSALAIVALTLASATATSCGKPSAASDEYFIGTNFWYGPILGGTGDGSNRERLCAELDMLKSLGITNLRVLSGAEGEEVDVKVYPVYQPEAGVYDEGLEEGLGYFLSELEKRDMKAVIYLNNAWEWSGGYGTYLEWAGAGKTPNTRTEGYGAYMGHVGQFITNEAAKELYFNHIRHVVGKYKDSGAIYSWQIANEPRCFSSDSTVRDAFVDFIWKSAEFIKSIDPQHMVSTGSEGKAGSEGDIQLYERIVSCPDIDYVNIHIWPLNWKWVSKESLTEDLPQAIQNTDAYIEEHIRIANELGKKVILEEFGFPRDGFKFSKDSSSTMARDAYYAHVFEKIQKSAISGGALLGCNFWGWGGLASQTPGHIYWEKGDDYCGDPSQEEQGLNSVYASDTSTLAIIKSSSEALKNAVTATFDMSGNGLYKEGEAIKASFTSQSSQNAAVELFFVSDTSGKESRDTVYTTNAFLYVRAGKVCASRFALPLAPGQYQVCPRINGKSAEPFSIDVVQSTSK